MAEEVPFDILKVDLFDAIAGFISNARHYPFEWLLNAYDLTEMTPADLERLTIAMEAGNRALLEFLNAVDQQARKRQGTIPGTPLDFTKA